MAGTLDAITMQAEKEPVELPRLTAAQVFIHYARIGRQLEQAIAAYKSIPDATQNKCTESLKAIVQSCRTAIDTAERLLEANR